MSATQLLVATLDLDNDTIQPSSVACNCELKATHMKPVRTKPVLR